MAVKQARRMKRISETWSGRLSGPTVRRKKDLWRKSQASNLWSSEVTLVSTVLQVNNDKSMAGIGLDVALVTSWLG